VSGGSGVAPWLLGYNLGLSGRRLNGGMVPAGDRQGSPIARDRPGPPCATARLARFRCHGAPTGTRIDAGQIGC